MTTGLQVINDSGIYQIDELYRNYQYTGESWTFSSAGDHTFTTTAGRVAPQLVFYSTWAAVVDSGGHTNNTGGLTFLGSTVSGTSWTYKVNGQGTCYLFDLPVQMQATGTGLQVWDSGNNGVFDSSSGSPMVVGAMPTCGGPYTFRYYYPIQTLGNAGGIVETYNGTATGGTGQQPYTKPTGRTWGWLADSMMHVQAWYFENTHAGGGPPNGDGNEHKFLGAMWASGDNFKIAARDYLYTGAYVSWGIGSGWGPTPIMFVDITSITSPGNSPTVTTSINPSNQTQSGTATSFAFNGENMAVSGGAATSYAWSLLNQSGGSWSLNTTIGATAAATVTGVSAGVTASAVQRCTVSVNGQSYFQDASLSYANTTTPVGVTVSSLSPGNQSPSAATSTASFASESLTVTGGSSVAYSWSVSGTNGTWVIASGQGTAAATAQVSGVPNSTTATATLTCNVTVDGTLYTRSCTLSFANTAFTPTGVTFSPVPGTYNDGLDTWSVTASQPVIWTWTRSGNTTRNITVPSTSGTSATSFSTTQSDSALGASTNCTISLTASGAGSGNWTITVFSPGNGGGGVGCVTADTFLPEIGQAGNVKVGDQLVIANPLTFAERKGIVSRADLKLADCVRIRTISGIELDCSTTAPIATDDGTLILAPDLAGRMVPVCDNGEYRYELVESVTDIGEQPIVHITCENDLFLAGKQPGRYLLHHNVKA